MCKVKVEYAISKNGEYTARIECTESDVDKEIFFCDSTYRRHDNILRVFKTLDESKKWVVDKIEEAKLYVDSIREKLLETEEYEF